MSCNVLQYTFVHFYTVYFYTHSIIKRVKLGLNTSINQAKTQHLEFRYKYTRRKLKERKYSCHLDRWSSFLGFQQASF